MYRHYPVQIGNGNDTHAYARLYAMKASTNLTSSARQDRIRTARKGAVKESFSERETAENSATIKCGNADKVRKRVVVLT